MRTGFFRRVLVLPVLAALCAVTLGAGAAAPVSASSISQGDLVYIYSDANLSGSSYILNISRNLSTVAGPCQNFFWESKSMNDCVSSYKILNLTSHAMRVVFYTDANYTGSWEAPPCIPPGYQYIRNQVSFNDLFSSVKITDVASC